jgi:DNA processing protein
MELTPDRIARAELLRAAEPATPGLIRHVREVGVVQAAADVRRGARVPGLDVLALQQRILDISGERDLEAANKIGARLVCPDDDEWPPCLDDLQHQGADCLGLWVRGEAALDAACERAVAIVGTRVPTEYGTYMASEISLGCAERGWTIVSGMAFGIDGAAHRAALAVGGVTVAVLACGVDVPYPKGHSTLYERILEAGLVVSEHPPASAPHRVRFLVRNRIIAALSAGTVVVEAAARSGARSTARHAGELFRQVMAVPGPATSSASVGCHQLLRDRPDTVLVTRADEVIEQVGALGEFAERPSGPIRRRDLLGPMVSRVLDAVPVRKSQPLARIATTAGMRPDAVEAALAALAVHGLVEERDGCWAMTTLGRSERRADSGADEELPLDW